jgi:hypothetical protein
VYYVDKDEQKGREIEISALRNSQSHPREKEPTWVRIRLLVDCKKAQADKPWVIFTSPATHYESYARTIMQAGLHEPEKIEADSIASVTAHHPYWLTARRGRSYYEGFKGPDTGGSPNNIHKGVMSVIKATIARMDEDRGHPFVMYQPLIILEGRLSRRSLTTSVRSRWSSSPGFPCRFRIVRPLTTTVDSLCFSSRKLTCRICSGGSTTPYRHGHSCSTRIRDC